MNPSGKEQKQRVAAVFSDGIASIPHLTSFLDVTSLVQTPNDADADSIDLVVGWGLKSNTRSAERFAQQHNLPYLRLEDGFLRSVGLGVEGSPPLSIVVDDVGIYYDATAPSRLEQILGGVSSESPQLSQSAMLERAQECITSIINARLSKYNSSPTGEVALGGATSKVLVVDQTAGDISIKKGCVPKDGFRLMLEAALEENPDADIIVKTHPDVLSGKKQGYLTKLAKSPRITVMSEPMNPIALLQKVDRVYTATSQLGFEALMVGAKVTCFGAPFYAGWGLTDDRAPIQRRQAKRSLEELFAAAYILYPRYIDPDTGERVEIETVIEYLSRQRHFFGQSEGKLFLNGFSVLKRGYMRKYLASPGNRVHFVRNAAAARRKGFDSKSRLVLWGARTPEDLMELATSHQAETWRIEDGFLRSSGLGTDLTMPASLVVDKQGIYFDPNTPSDLETLISNHDFTQIELDRALSLKERVLATKVSKYNLATQLQLEVPAKQGQTVILVPGQVEGDASIRLGCVDIRTNEDLLCEVRTQNPDAFIIFKPHPDVVSGNRKGKVSAAKAQELCDMVVIDASLADCLEKADQVHTMTSLVGFEALLRGLVVHVYGRPFYSGWGLTKDRHIVERRKRVVKLEELVAAVLILYPRYLNGQTMRFTTPEYIVTMLERDREMQRAGLSANAPWVRRQWNKLLNIWKGLIYVR